MVNGLSKSGKCSNGALPSTYKMIMKNPIKIKSYPMPYAMWEIIKEEVTAILDADIIEPSKSAYCSPVVIVKKKDGSDRFCIDFRKLNLITKFDTEPMGNPDPFGTPDGCYQFKKMPLHKSTKRQHSVV